MKTKKILSKLLAVTLILGFIIPTATAIECCPRATWTKTARDYRDNYIKCIFQVLGGGILTPPEIHAYWELLTEGADDYAVNMSIPVTVDLMRGLIAQFLVDGGLAPDLPSAYAALSAAETACGWPPAPECYLEVSETDYCFFGTTNLTCTNFRVEVIVQDVTDMKGCAIKLGYNASLLHAIRVIPTAITATTTDWLPVDAGGVFHFDAHPTINNTRTYNYQGFLPYCYVWVSAWGFTPFSGTGAVFEIEFHIEMSPSREPPVTTPQNRCLCSYLDLFETEVLDSASDPIDHSALDGRYCNIVPARVVGWPTAVCSVYPGTQYVCENVTFDGSASDDGGAGPLTYMWDVGSDGTYDIVTSSKKASWHCDAVGTYNVTLTVVNAMGLNDTVPEPQTWECIEKIGTVQDLYTSPNRFCNQTTTFVGKGLAGDPAILDPLANPGYVDALTPDVNFTLFVEVTYNGGPRMHVLVAIEILYEWQLIDQEAPGGFPNGYEPLNMSIAYRTIETDKDGIARTWFRIPMWCPGLPFGKWLILASCKVQEIKTIDWIRFHVGYPIQIINVTTVDSITKVPKEKFQLYETVGIKIWYKNIMFMPKHVLFTQTIYDICDVPIGFSYEEVIAPPSELYCHPFYNYTYCDVFIPQWTYVGKAKVYVSAMTDWPRLCGSAYCPEGTAEIMIEWVPPP